MLSFKRDHLGVFLISFSILILEITLTKIFSVTLWYHFSYLVISLAMFGFSFGGLLVYRFFDGFKTNHNKNLFSLSMILAISMLFGLKVAMSSHVSLSLNQHDLFVFFGIYVFCTAPFIFSSMILSLLFIRREEHSGSIYGADLLGASMGCVAAVLLISVFSAPQVILIASLSCALAAMVFITPTTRWDTLLSTLLISVIVGLFVHSHFFFHIDFNKSYSEEREHVLFEKWSPLARITVLSDIYFRGKNSKMPFGWGMSKTYQPKEPIKQLWIEQDANAGTPIEPFDGDVSKVDFLKYDITALPYYLRKQANVFILGVGGGRDVLTALVFHNPKITGVDIHPTIIELINHQYRHFAGDLYQLKPVSVFVREGRSFLAKSHQLFDIIQIPLIDSWAATVAGAFAMTENALYTTEAFQTYIQHLTPEGFLSVTRFYSSPETQTIKIALLARVALEHLSVKNPEQHIAIIKNTVAPYPSVATVLVKRTPISTAEIKQIKKIAHDLAFDIVYLPSYPFNEPLFSEALTTKHIDSLISNYYYDIRPPTDDKPFFFQMFYFSHLKDLLTHQDIAGQAFNYFGVIALYFLLLVSIILVSLFYLIPFLLTERSQKPPLLWGMYFILLGFGFKAQTHGTLGAYF